MRQKRCRQGIVWGLFGSIRVVEVFPPPPAQLFLYVHVNYHKRYKRDGNMGHFLNEGKINWNKLLSKACRKRKKNTTTLQLSSFKHNIIVFASHLKLWSTKSSSLCPTGTGYIHTLLWWGSHTVWGMLTDVLELFRLCVVLLLLLLVIIYSMGFIISFFVVALLSSLVMMVVDNTAKCRNLWMWRYSEIPTWQKNILWIHHCAHFGYHILLKPSHHITPNLRLPLSSTHHRFYSISMTMNTELVLLRITILIGSFCSFTLLACIFYSSTSRKFRSLPFSFTLFLFSQDEFLFPLCWF